MSARAPHALVCALLGALCALPPTLAAAQDAEKQARGHFRRGETHFAMGRFVEALKEYQAAYELKPLPGFLFNIGQCHRNLGHFEEAVFSFKRYLRLKPDATNRAAVEELVSDLERQIAAQKATRPPALTGPTGPTGLGAPPPPPPPRPVYQRWWFWTGIAAVAAGAAVGVYFGVRPSSAGPPASALGNIDFK
ncbi:MAG: tetratricopeptide repeat protein [Deltaproteobacteria bacterium]|nr:tetratricopeptide repeat protein [Deltaproteobacteria bacterium]